MHKLCKKYCISFQIEMYSDDIYCISNRRKINTQIRLDYSQKNISELRRNIKKKIFILEFFLKFLETDRHSIVEEHERDPLGPSPYGKT